MNNKCRKCGKDEKFYNEWRYADKGLIEFIIMLTVSTVLLQASDMTWSNYEWVCFKFSRLYH